MLTPHFGIFNPPQRGRSAEILQFRRPQAKDAPSPDSAEEALALYSRIERHALLLQFGAAADFEPTARREDAELPHGRPWRFAGMLLPPYS